MSELENIAYNSDEASQVMMFGEKVNIPRKQVAFSDPGISYRFAGADVPGKPWPEFLSIIRDEMNNYLRVQGILPKDSEDKLNYVLVNLYRDGSDYIGPHRDNEPDMYDITTIQDGTAKKETVIVSLSFGASRDFIFQRQDNPAIRYPMILQSGDLLVMRGDTNK
jgi:alkylated DNA repair dioxygenase AlkB